MNIPGPRLVGLANDFMPTEAWPNSHSNFHLETRGLGLNECLSTVGYKARYYRSVAIGFVRTVVCLPYRHTTYSGPDCGGQLPVVKSQVCTWNAGNVWLKQIESKKEKAFVMYKLLEQLVIRNKFLRRAGRRLECKFYQWQNEMCSSLLFEPTKLETASCECFFFSFCWLTFCSGVDLFVDMFSIVIGILLRLWEIGNVI